MADDKKIIFSMVGVSKSFQNNKQVLKDIYLSFFYGAKIGIIGLNGSGKSTLMKIIALPPTAKAPGCRRPAAASASVQPQELLPHSDIF